MQYFCCESMILRIANLVSAARSFFNL
jgi:hypothetical protein